MRKAAALLAALLLPLLLAACRAEGGAESTVTVELVCQSEGIGQIFYSWYIGGDYRGSGGVADLDGVAIEPGRVFSIPFGPGAFETGDDPSRFSLDLSPYGPGDTHELATVGPVSLPAEEGGHLTVVLAGDKEKGFIVQTEP